MSAGYIPSMGKNRRVDLTLDSLGTLNQDGFPTVCTCKTSP